jgi:hypothetical protein
MPRPDSAVAVDCFAGRRLRRARAKGRRFLGFLNGVPIAIRCTAISSVLSNALSHLLPPERSNSSSGAYDRKNAVRARRPVAVVNVVLQSVVIARSASDPAIFVMQF